MYTQEVRAYLRDFLAQIQLIDTHVFPPKRCDISLIVRCEERVNKIGGAHIGNFAGYLSKWDAATLGFSKKSQINETPLYLIYETALARLIEATCHYEGDHAMRQMWLTFAVVLVRFRVLASKKDFPEARSRTKASMIKHRLVFSPDGNEIKGARSIHSEYLEMLPQLKKNIFNLDALWTLQLFARSLASGETFTQALGYIASD